MRQRGSSYNFGPSQIGIGDQKKVLDSLGNSAGILNQILSNTYSGFISAKIETLQNLLNKNLEILENIYELQNKYVYLVDIYTILKSGLSSTNVLETKEKEQKQGVDFQLFENTKKQFQALLKKIEGKNKFNQLFKIKTIQESITKAQESFDLLERSVESFLNKKRDYWPRLYLLTNSEVLNLLSASHSTVSEVLNEVIHKVFNASKIDISEEEDARIKGFIGTDGENLAFRNVLLTTRSNIELVLEGITKAMQNSVHLSITEAFNSLLSESGTYPNTGEITQTNGTRPSSRHSLRNSKVMSNQISGSFENLDTWVASVTC